jgi:hypothetical protein
LGWRSRVDIDEHALKCIKLMHGCEGFAIGLVSQMMLCVWRSNDGERAPESSLDFLVEVVPVECQLHSMNSS